MSLMSDSHSTSSSSLSVAIPSQLLFDGKNFNLWKLKIKAVLISKGWWNQVKPITGTEVEEKDAAIKAQHAYTLLLMSQPMEQLQVVADVEPGDARAV